MQEFDDLHSVPGSLRRAVGACGSDVGAVRVLRVKEPYKGHRLIAITGAAEPVVVVHE
jgi:hypothetical protein